MNEWERALDVVRGSPEMNRRTAAALAWPAKALVGALTRDAENRKALSRDVAYSMARKAATPEEAIKTVLGPGMQGGPGGLDMVMAAPLVARALRAAPAAESTGIRAYHGSPYDFDKFSLSKIGTGEGAQAYGHGLYFAEREGVARGYRDRLASAGAVRPDETAIAQYKDQWDATVQRAMAARREADSLLYKNGPTDASYAKAQEKMLAAHAEQDALHQKMADETIARRGGTAGRMYEVNIAAKPEQFLDWDKPLSAQSDAVKNFFAPAAEKSSVSWAGPYIYRSKQGSILGEGASADPLGVYGRSAMQSGLGGPRLSSELRDAGIPGIKYLDQGSRNAMPLLEGKAIPADNWPAQLAAEVLRSKRTPSAAIKSIEDGLRKYPDKAGFGNEAARAAIELIRSGKIAEAPNTSNYVLFRDDIIDILRKYGLPPVGVGSVLGGAAAALSPDQAQAAPVDAAGIARALREAR